MFSIDRGYQVFQSDARRHAGATETKAAAIDDERSDLLTSRKRIAVRFAGALAVDHHKVDDALWTEMRRHFSEAEITGLTAHTMLYIGFGRLNEIVGADPASGRKAVRYSWGRP